MLKEIFLILTLMLSFTITTIAKDKEVKLDPCKEKEINFLHFTTLCFANEKKIKTLSSEYLVKGKYFKYLAIIDNKNQIKYSKSFLIIYRSLK